MQFKWFRRDYGAVAGGMDSSPCCKGFWRGCTYVSWTGGVLSSVRNLITSVKCFTRKLPIPVCTLSQISRKIKNMKILKFFLFNLFKKGNLFMLENGKQSLPLWKGERKQGEPGAPNKKMSGRLYVSAEQPAL